MRIAVVVGGWHYPEHFFTMMENQIVNHDTIVDKFVVSHRDPDLPIVSKEKNGYLQDNGKQFISYDRRLYDRYATKDGLRFSGWEYIEAPDTYGDWEFLNQWLENHDYKSYDLILNCHDDIYITSLYLLYDMIYSKAV